MRKRFYKFGFGILLGTLLSYAFFNDHDITSWMPNGRILAVIQKINADNYSEKVLCQIDCYKFSSSDLTNLYTDGDVDFGASETRSEPRVYLVNYVNSEDQTIQGTFEIFRNDAVNLIDIKLLGQLNDCNCK